MKALCWHGFHDVRYDTVPDPIIQSTTDAILHEAGATSTARGILIGNRVDTQEVLRSCAEHDIDGAFISVNP